MLLVIINITTQNYVKQVLHCFCMEITILLPCVEMMEDVISPYQIDG